ncbi:hypothetical protein [Streptosporangium sp. NPDC001681]|uniref:hypothetical protein n=1 Tax=Streptosporangium sp. NPDC001681 TaxID=3154395 RepID=UPI00332EC05F
MTYGETDELSFGGEREPWLRTWAAAHRRLLAITVAAAVALTGLGTGGWYLYQQSLLPSPPPDVALPPMLGFIVQLCLKEHPSCTAGTIDQVAALVHEIPEVASSAVVTPEEILARTSETSIGGENPAWTWPARIDGKVHRAADFEAVRRQLAGKPGVVDVQRSSENFWKGTADLQVNLCGLSRTLAACRNGAATDAQRDAVVARLREQDGVQEVFLQDRAFGLRLIKHYYPEQYLTINDVPERLYARLDDPAKARAAGQAMLGVPGVESANLIR